MINVLHLRDTDRVCGPGKTILETSVRIDTSSYNLSIGLICLDRENVEKNLYLRAARERGVRVFPIRSFHQYDPRIVKTIKELIKRENIHILHSHEYKTDILAFLVSKVHDIPIITTCHGWIVNSLKSRLLISAGKRILPFFDKVIAVSPLIRDEILRYGTSPEKVIQVFNAIVADNYRPGLYEDGMLRKKYDLPNNAVLIGNIGRLSPEKGQKDFLQAAELICRQDKYGNVYFFLIGDGADMQELQRHVGMMGLSSRIFFTGHLQDVRPVYQDLDILALTSYTEGFPNVILESLCMETAVAATKVGGVSDIIKDRRTGCLIASHDPEAIAEQLIYLLDNPQVARQLALQGKQMVLEKFEFQRRISIIQTVYDEIMQTALETRSPAGWKN